MSFGEPFFFAPDGTSRSESAHGVRFLFTGREYLAQVGLYDYRHRAYSPTLGRFLQVDPVVWDVNRQSYVENSVLSARDAVGLDGMTIYIPLVGPLSWHIPGTERQPFEEVHERQHREDYKRFGWKMEDWKMEMRAFRAQFVEIDAAVRRLEAKRASVGLCPEEKEKLEWLLKWWRLTRGIATSVGAAKGYANDHRRWWQKKHIISPEEYSKRWYE